jgi:hypothetical protein
MLIELWPLAAKHCVKFILNAGGLNPEGARAAIARAFREKGWKATLATVSGDAVLERFDELQAEGVMPGDAQLARLFTFGVLNWTARWYRAGGRRSLDEIAAEASSFLLRR